MYSGSDDLEEREEHAEQDRNKEVEMQGEGQAVDAAELSERQDANSISHSSSVYVSCVSEVDALEPHPHQGQVGHNSQSAGAQREELETSAASNRTLTMEHAQSYEVTHNHTEVENGLTGQVPHLATPNSTPKFNNLLDKCNAEESDIVKPKPRVISHPNPSLPQQGTHSILRQPPGLAVSQHTRTRADTISSIDMPLDGDMQQQLTTSPELSPSPLGEMAEDPGPLQSFLFPVSNSPMDIICMLSRLASFTGELLTVLTPKIRKTNYVHNNKVRCNLPRTSPCLE